MDMLMIWHAGTVPQYRDRYLALEEFFDSVNVLVPSGWKEVEKHPYTGQIGERTVVKKMPCWLPYHPYSIIYRSLGQVVREVSPDILYVHEEPPALCAAQAAWFAQKYDIPLFLDSAVINRIGNLGGANPLEMFVYRVADTVYYRNEKCRTTLLERGCPSEILNGPMPNGVSTRTFSPASDEQALSFLSEMVQENVAALDAGSDQSGSDFADAPLRIGFAGRICYEKGIDLLLDATRSQPDVAVYLCGPIGNPSYREAIQETPGAQYCGEISGENMNKFYSACDITVLPSRRTPKWEEQFGRVLTESISCGTPALGSNTGMIHQIVGENWVFPEGDVRGLQELIAHLSTKQRRKELLEEQLRRVEEKFSWQTIAKTVREDLNHVLNSHASPSA
jgi:glycosyltransferase involved in cell wall biosynthesis